MWTVVIAGSKSSDAFLVVRTYETKEEAVAHVRSLERIQEDFVLFEGKPLGAQYMEQGRCVRVPPIQALEDEHPEPLESPCPRCGEKALVKTDAAGFGAFGGAIECKSCTAKSTLTWGESLMGDTSWEEPKP